MKVGNSKCATFIDLDGVIVDSTAECYEVSIRAYYGFSPLPLDSEEYKRRFFMHRGLVGPPYQYLVLHRVLASGKVPDNIADVFRKVESEVSKEERREFESLFFSIRHLYQKHLQRWLDLQELTVFGRQLRKRQLPHCFVITTKDGTSAKLLLDHFDITVERIFDYSDHQNFGTKGKIISDFLDHSSYDRAVFIDDSSDHLATVTDSRITCYFAPWGYGKNRDFMEVPEDFLAGGIK
jgi:phosphoglycolate phosphatase-like HAD superfamily hydrolase